MERGDVFGDTRAFVQPCEGVRTVEESIDPHRERERVGKRERELAGGRVPVFFEPGLPPGSKVIDGPGGTRSARGDEANEDQRCEDARAGPRARAHARKLHRRFDLRPPSLEPRARFARMASSSAPSTTLSSDAAAPRSALHPSP